MTELLGFNATTVFLIIAIAGFLFLLASFFLGDLFEQIGLDVELEADGFGDGIPGWFDSRVLSVFLTAFGGFGFIGMQLGAGTFLSSLCGLAGGVALGGVVFWFARLLHRQQASSSISTFDLIGRVAQVTVTIPHGGIGQINCRVGPERIEKLARTNANATIEAGSTVVISDVADEIVIVIADEEINQFINS
ncbi:MAG: hypothetical protein SF097_13920 [Acidobacteriota bacterium]|nr:hypothetical protein [Acidobacteriota bacterium]